MEITKEDAIAIAESYGLLDEVMYCVNELNMNYYDALYEWDLI